MGTNEKNMTAGSPGKLIITFAIPLMLGNIFQQFYTMADTMIVGQVVGVEALAAVGAGDWLVWLVLGIMTGITQGFSILVSQYYGAGEKENLKCAVAKSYIMTALLSVIVLAVSEGAVYHVLLFLQTPDNVIDLTMLYLRLIFAGVPIIAAYNIFAAILRALGNSRSPLIAMTVAAVINVGLDLLFVAVFGWGVAGAAIATVIAQGFSALYCLLVLRKIRDIRLEKEDFYRQPSMSLQLLKLGTPLAIQNVIISVGGLTVQYVINGFGFLFVAGFTATNKLYGILEMAAVSYGYAITTYVGQNLGAKKYQRIRKGVRSGTYMAVLTSVFISGMMVLIGRNILSLFVSGEPEQIRQVLDIAYKYLFIMAVFLWILYLLHVYRSAIQGLGNTLIPLASGIAEFVMRVSVALLLPKWIGEEGIYYAEICFGVADITGAFVAGLAVSGLKKNEYVVNRFNTLSYMLLSPIFFANIGLAMTLDGLTGKLIVFMLLLMLLAVVTKVIGCGLGAKIMRYTNKESLQIGIGMISRGEVALIVANKGASVGLMSEKFMTPLVIMVVFTTIVTPILLKFVFPKKKDNSGETPSGELAGLEKSGINTGLEES